MDIQTAPIEHAIVAAPGADILVVDDHHEITDMVADALIDEGYRVRVAYNGAAALKAVTSQTPDLVLLDVSMPLLSGDQVLLQLRTKGFPKLPVILMTADQTPERFRHLGASQLLRKPFDLPCLFKAIAQCVGLSY